MTPRPKTEAEATVSQDPLTAVLDKLDRVLVILEGRHDDNGEHHPGLSHRVTRLENIVKWAFGVITLVVGGLGLAWVNFLAGPRPPVPPTH